MRAINDEPDDTKAGNYWRWLKRMLRQEGLEPVSATHGFKFEVPDGKQRIADVLWNRIDKNEYLGAMRENVVDSTHIKALLRGALTDRIKDREIFMKGIGSSHYYEEPQFIDEP